MRQKMIEKIRQLHVLNSAMKNAAAGDNPMDIPRHVKDPQFLLKGNPDFLEHDANGYRNTTIPHRADVLTVGDSQVYGACVRSDQSWPFQLQTMLEKTVYNAGMEGWGVVQYAMAAEELASMIPSLLVVSVYTGNDIYESFLTAKQSTHPLAQSFWKSDYDGLLLPELSGKHASDAAVRKAMATTPDQSEGEVLERLAERGVADCSRCEVEGSRFYLTENFRRVVQDHDHPAIQAGFAITEKALTHIQSLAVSYGFGLQVVLIPTREYLVHGRGSDVRMENMDALNRLGQAEQKTLDRLNGFCAEKSIACLDLSEHLTHYIGSRIYPQDSRDGHPNAKGCRIIANYLNAKLRPALMQAEESGVYPLY